MPTLGVGNESLVLDYLANHQECIRDLAGRFFDEWRPVYEQREMTLNDVVEAFERRAMQIDSMPLALVAMRGDRVVGTVCLKEQDLETRPKLTPWLAGLFVMPDHRGRGVGTALIHRLVAEARRLRATELYLWTPSVERLYLRLGWSRIDVADYCGLYISIMHRCIDNAQRPG